MLRHTLILTCLAAASLSAQTVPSQLVVQKKTRTFGSSLAFDLLLPATTNNPLGIPIPSGCPPWLWPISVTVGDIDNDGQDDLLFCGEQRFLLAVKVKGAGGGLLANPSVIWVHFDDGGWIVKHEYGSDRAAIADFDGDGLNEVAAVIGPAVGGSSNRIVLIEDGAGALDPTLNEPMPVFGAEFELDTIVTNWTFSATTGGGVCGGAGGANFAVRESRIIGGGARPEVLVHGTQGGRVAAFVYDPGLASLRPLYARSSTGAGAHGLAVVDLDQDGHDDLLGHHLINVWKGYEVDLLATLPHVPVFCGGGNHVDSAFPYDADGDGTHEFVVQHCGYDLLVSAPDTNGNLSVVWENTRLNDGSQAIYHGQTAVVANLLAGPDTFGFTGQYLVSTPKGQLNSAGSVVTNGNGNELCISDNTIGSTWVGPFGPNLGTLARIDFDGGNTDEILSLNGTNSSGTPVSRYSIWRLQLTNNDPDLPYEWSEIYGYPRQDSTISPTRAIALDFFGSPNEDILLVGRQGFEVIYAGL